jgi:hypothetical protein
MEANKNSVENDLPVKMWIPNTGSLKEEVWESSTHNLLKFLMKNRLFLASTRCSFNKEDEWLLVIVRSEGVFLVEKFILDSGLTFLKKKPQSKKDEKGNWIN